MGILVSLKRCWTLGGCGVREMEMFLCVTSILMSTQLI